MLLAEALAFAIAGLVFFRHRENMLMQSAEAAFPGPIIATQFPTTEHLRSAGGRKIPLCLAPKVSNGSF
jgi:hypothetical protein